jgi:hypothetical protein
MNDNENTNENESVMSHLMELLKLPESKDAPDVPEPWYYEYWIRSVEQLKNDLLLGYDIENDYGWNKAVDTYPWLLGTTWDNHDFAADFEINQYLLPHERFFTMSIPVDSPLTNGETIYLGKARTVHDDTCEHAADLCIRDVEEWFEEEHGIVPAVTSIFFQIRNDSLIAVFQHSCKKCRTWRQRLSDR